MSTNSKEAKDRLKQLEDRGLGHTLEAIKLRGPSIKDVEEYIARLEAAKATETSSMRKAQRLLERLKKEQKA